MRLCWATDVHLNFVGAEGIARFCDAVNAARPDVFVITGDIAEADSLGGILDDVEQRTEQPTWFVLGNHDFYRGAIAEVRAAAAARRGRVRWLGSAGVVALGAETGLIGHDGFGDARLGVPETTRVVLNDSLYIAELAQAESRGRADFLALLRALGDESAAHVERTLSEALERFPRVVLATHVPPWREACWHEGHISNDQWLPFFACDAVGQTVQRVMAAHPERRLTVLCGHTHGGGRADIAPNITCFTGAAEYGAPALQAAIEL